MELAQELMELVQLLHQLGVQGARLRQLVGVLPQLLGNLVYLLAKGLLPLERLLDVLPLFPGQLLGAPEVPRQLLRFLLQDLGAPDRVLERGH